MIQFGNQKYVTYDFAENFSKTRDNSSHLRSVIIAKDVYVMYFCDRTIYLHMVYFLRTCRLTHANVCKNIGFSHSVAYHMSPCVAW